VPTLRWLSVVVKSDGGSRPTLDERYLRRASKREMRDCRNGVGTRVLEAGLASSDMATICPPSRSPLHVEGL
jgi:hypothetical protein